MKYIEKNFGVPEVINHEAELERCQLDEVYLTDTKHREGATGSQLYDMVRDMQTFDSLKQQLYKDQGGICCYCGMKLEFPFNPQFRVEHVLPKEHHRELVGEYKNLLLSCRATKEETEERSKASKKQRKAMMHCDEAKGSIELTYSPLQEGCNAYFIYKLNGEVEGKDIKAKEDVITLGLNCTYLKNRRHDTLMEILFAGEDMLDNDLLTNYASSIMQRTEDNMFGEYCFVISNVINQLLSPQQP